MGQVSKIHYIGRSSTFIQQTLLRCCRRAPPYV